MKKILVAIFALAVGVSVAFAGIAVNWNIQYGAYTHDAPNVTDWPSPNNMLGTYSAIWQLIYAGPNDAIDPIPALVNPADGPDRTWDDWMTWQATGNPSYQDAAWVTAGYVYQRVFETQVQGTISNGDYYFETGLLELDTTWSAGPPAGLSQNFYVDTPSAGFQPDTEISVIPEPATMSLLGLGALVMAIRRRRRS